MPDKFIKEIEEILEQAERSGPQDTSKSPSKEGRRQRYPFNPLRGISRLRELIRISPGRVMLAGISLLLVAVLLNTVVPGSVHLLVWAGIVLFFIAYGLFFLRPSFQYERRWRGRLVEDRVSLWGKLKRWLRG